MLWGRLPPPALAESLNEKPAKAALSPQARDDAVKQASLAIALVDPALRMEVTPNAEGGVTVSGWVDGVEQFDRLAQGLSGLRPLPRLAVHTASEMLDVLQDAASAHGAHLQFTPAGSGKVQATGLVATPAQHQAILAQLRERAPQGIEIVDGLRVASMQAPAVRRWLQAQGLGVTEVEWDGEQLLVQVDVNAAQRRCSNACWPRRSRLWPECPSCCRPAGCSRTRHPRGSVPAPADCLSASAVWSVARRLMWCWPMARSSSPVARVPAGNWWPWRQTISYGMAPNVWKSHDETVVARPLAIFVSRCAESPRGGAARTGRRGAARTDPGPAAGAGTARARGHFRGGLAGALP
ncbi:hypothetical protein ACFQOZ_06285 [Comamonas endophytica]|uniref:hypothetical protein n=1 Tax=Comamonas endophytica TaxID=2949090 RepID=UPI00360F4D94